MTACLFTVCYSTAVFIEKKMWNWMFEGFHILLILTNIQKRGLFAFKCMYWKKELLQNIFWIWHLKGFYTSSLYKLVWRSSSLMTWFLKWSTLRSVVTLHKIKLQSETVFQTKNATEPQITFPYLGLFVWLNLNNWSGFQLSWYIKVIPSIDLLYLFMNPAAKTFMV